MCRVAVKRIIDKNEAAYRTNVVNLEIKIILEPLFDVWVQREINLPESFGFIQYNASKSCANKSRCDQNKPNKSDILVFILRVEINMI